MSTYELVSFDLCPYVRRSVITLQEKGVPYDIAYIDLAAKPEGFADAQRGAGVARTEGGVT